MQIYLPQLVRKLLFTEHIVERLQISKVILETIHSLGDCGQIEAAIRNQFVSLVKVCALNPTAKQRALLLEVATFYAQNYLTHPYEVPIAA
ncbi:MAG: hypothetical protein EOO48_00335 [Flavobacterium sp.]|nr:MAG: hypothetical protein EOO48_00335 [Flavobacterium sp.]